METERILLVSLAPALNGYDRKAAVNLYGRLLERASGISLVESATIARVVPFSGTGLSFGPVLGGVVSQGEGVASDCNLVGPDYFRVLGIELVRGRDFRASDREGSPRVAVVNETLASRLWPGSDPLGQTIRLGRQAELWAVVGVARDSRYRSATEPARPFLYLPAFQLASPLLAGQFPELTLHIRTSGNPLALARPLRAVLREMDPHLRSTT